MGITAADVKQLRQLTSAPMMECKKALTDTDGNFDEAQKLLRERGIAKMSKRADRETAEGVVRMQVDEGNRRGTAVVVTCETDFTAKNASFQDMATTVLAAAHALEGDELSPDQVLDASHEGASVRATVDAIANSVRENMGIARVVRCSGVCGFYVHFDGKIGALVEAEVAEDQAGAAAVGELLRGVAMHIAATDPTPLAVDSGGIDPKIVDEEREILIKQAMDSGKPEDIARKIVEGRMKKFYSERALLDQPYVKDPSKSVAQVIEECGKDLGAAIAVKGFTRIQIGG